MANAGNNIALASYVGTDGESYKVSGVRLENFVSADSVENIKQVALEAVKQMAFDDLMSYLKRDGMRLSILDIDSAITSFNILNEHYDANFYAIQANFVFNKNIVNSLIKSYDSRTKNYDKKEDMFVLLRERNNLVSEYNQFQKILQSKKINFSTVSIDNGEIKMQLFNVNENEVRDTLKSYGFDGKIYLNI